MRKTVFFVFGVILAIIIIRWVDGYYILPQEERGKLSIWQYVQEDLGSTFKQAKTNVRAIPDMLVSIQQNQGGVYKALMSQIQRGLESYYLLEGSYPKELGQIMDTNQLPENLGIKYRQQGSGYVLQLISKDGQVLYEIKKK